MSSRFWLCLGWCLHALSWASFAALFRFSSAAQIDIALALQGVSLFLLLLLTVVSFRL